MNGDGLGDIFVTASGGSRNAHLVLGEPFWLSQINVVAQAAVDVDLPNAQAFVMAVEDTDGDQLDDFALLVPGDDVYLFLGAGTLSKLSPVSYSRSTGQPLVEGVPFANTTKLAGLGDVTGDGLADIALDHGQAIHLCRGDASGTPACAQTPINAQDLNFIRGVGNVHDLVNEDLSDVLFGIGSDAYLYVGTASGLQYSATFTGVADAASALYAVGADLNADGSSDLLLVPDASAAAQMGFEGFGQPPPVDQGSLPPGGGGDQTGPGMGPGIDASSADLHVNDDGYCTGYDPCYLSIQDAVDEAQTGDFILVHPGVYPSAEIATDNVTVTGINADAVFCGWR